MFRLLNIFILLLNVEVIFHCSGATSTTADVFVHHPDGGDNIEIAGPNDNVEEQRRFAAKTFHASESCK